MNEILDALKIDWEPTDYYNFEDLNRVEYYTQLVSELVVFFRGNTAANNFFSERDMTSIEFADSLNRLEKNIEVLLSELNNPTGTIQPKTDWWYNTSFSYIDANRLETNLLLLYKYVQGNINNFKYCGTFTCGDEGVI